MACCQLESLRHTPSADLRRVLHELPETLDQAYENVLNSIDEEDRGHAHRLLQYAAVAIRPLRVEELAQALAVDFGAAGRAGNSGINSGWRTTGQRQAMPVLSACSSLISIESQVVQFSHLSVKEFLTSERLANSRRGVSRYHISLQSAHATLAQACFSVLLRLNDRSNRSSLCDFPLAQYAANYWNDHIRFEGVSSESKIRDTIKYFLDGDKPHWKAWHRFRDDDKRLSPPADDPPDPLFYAAFYGLYSVVELLIARHPRHVNSRVHSAVTPLYGALMGGHFRIAQLLYDHGAKVNVRDGTNSTPLHVASHASESDEVVKILQWLLDHGADVRLRDENDKTPLHLSADKGSLATVRMLIRRKAEIEARDKDGRTPLHVAVDRQSSETVQILIDHEANVNSRDKKGKTPLHLAVHWRHFDIARMLIDHKANVNERDVEGETPLHVAAKWEHPDIARMLIEHKANVNARNNKRKTPLHVAVHHGRLDIARKLIKHDAHVNAQDDKGQTPMHVAVDQDHHDIAQLLLRHNADIKIQDSHGRVVALYMELDGEENRQSVREKYES